MLFNRSFGQGTVEYLVIVSIVVVLSFVVVGVVVSQTGNASNVSTNSAKINSLAGEISIIETGVNPDGNYLVVLKSNIVGAIVVTNVKIGDYSKTFAEQLNQGSKQNFIVPGATCNIGEKKALPVLVTYTDQYALSHVQKYSGSLSFSCENYSISNTAQQGIPPIVNTGDVISPTISLQSPVNNSSFSGIVDFNFLSSDNNAISACVLRIDGVDRNYWTKIDSNTYNVLKFNLSSLADGIHTWDVNCIDYNSNWGTSVGNDWNIIALHVPVTIFYNNSWGFDNNSDYSFDPDNNCGISLGKLKIKDYDEVFGDGTDGALVVSSLNLVVNDYNNLVGNEFIGDNNIAVANSAAFTSGDEVLIIQMQDANKLSAGQYTFAKISSVDKNNLILTSPLDKNYYSGVYNSTSAISAQVIRVPQYTNVTINSGASMTAKTWDGMSGGIIVFRDLNSLVINGKIDVNEKGFRGGISGSTAPEKFIGFSASGGGGGGGGSGGHVGNGGSGGIPSGGTGVSNPGGSVSGAGGTGSNGGGGGGAGGGWGSNGGGSACCGGGAGGSQSGDTGLSAASATSAGGGGGGGAGGRDSAGGGGGARAYSSWDNNSTSNLSNILLGGGASAGAGGGGGGGSGDYANPNGGSGGSASGSGGTRGTDSCSGTDSTNGSSGGSGGNGGGIIMVYASNISLTGTVTANGGNGGNGGAGGKGADIGGCGTTHPAGAGGGGGGGNGGAGGTIYLFSTNMNAGTNLVLANAGGAGSGGAAGAKGTGGSNDAGNGGTGFIGSAGITGKIRFDYLNLTGTTTQLTFSKRLSTSCYADMNYSPLVQTDLNWISITDTNTLNGGSINYLVQFDSNGSWFDSSQLPIKSDKNILIRAKLNVGSTSPELDQLTINYSKTQ